MSIRLEEVDKNFKIESTLGIEDLKLILNMWQLKLSSTMNHQL